MVLGGSIYSAMDGPGGPIFWGGGALMLCPSIGDDLATPLVACFDFLMSSMFPWIVALVN